MAKVMLAFAAILVAGLFQGFVEAQMITHTVGGTVGWTIPPGGEAVYSSWAANNTVSVGDVLVFNFAAGAHDVTQVNKADYDACTSTSPLTLVTTSPARIPLTTPGEHYFICNFPGHCSAGQKVMVNAIGAATTPPSASPAPSMTPPPMTPPPMAAPPMTPPMSAPTPAMSAPTPAMSAPPPGMSAPTPATSGDVPSPAPSTTPTGSSPPPGPMGPSSPPGPMAPSSPTPAGDSAPPPPGSATSLAGASAAAFLSVFVAILL